MSHLHSVTKFCSILTVLLGVTAYSPLKATALDVTQLPLVGPALQRGLSIDPSLEILDRGQVCLAFCSSLSRTLDPATPVFRSPAPGTAPVTSAPNPSLGQQVMQIPNQVLQIPNQVLQPTQVTRSTVTVPVGTPVMMPGQGAPGQLPPGQLPPGQMLPGQAQPLPGQMPPGQIPNSVAVQPGQIGPTQVAPGQTPNQNPALGLGQIPVLQMAQQLLR